MLYIPSYIYHWKSKIKQWIKHVWRQYKNDSEIKIKTWELSIKFKSSSSISY